MSDTLVKDPDARLDYGFNWAPSPIGPRKGPWLSANEKIVQSTWIVSPPGGLVVDASSHDDTTTTVWLTGGEAGTDYRVTNRITTDQARTDDRTICLPVRER